MPDVISNQQLPADAENLLTPARKENSRGAFFFGSDWLWLSSIFILSLGARLWFNFVDNHPNCSATGDAFEYLSIARSLYSLPSLPANIWGDVLACLSGTAPDNVLAQVRAAIKPLSGLSMSGPVYPLFLSACYLVAGNACGWQVPVAAQCLLSALTCVLLFFLGRLLWNRQVGLVAGGLAAIYPGFIINSGRLITETSAAFMLTLLVLLAVKGFSREGGSGRFRIFFSGFLACALQFTRSALSLISLLLVPLFVFQNRRRKPFKTLLFFIAGFALLALPWLAWQKVVTGHASLVIDRVSHLNFAVGNCVEREGWFGVPYPDLGGVEQKSLTKLFKESFRADPPGWVELTLSKVPRLVKFPWNDFRVAIGGVSFFSQVIIHQLLLLAAAWGLVLGLAGGEGEKPASNQQLAGRCVVLSVIAVHLLYVAFVAQSRYFLTAMPFGILFSAAGTVSLFDLLNYSRCRRTVLLAIASGFLFFAAARANFGQLLPIILSPAETVVAGSIIKTLALSVFIICAYKAARLGKGRGKATAAAAVICGVSLFPFVCLPLKAHGRLFEWQCRLDTQGQSVRQVLPVPPTAGDRQYYLMIDSNGWQPLSQGLKIKVAGKQVDGPLIPGIALMDKGNRFEDQGGLETFLPYEHILDCLTVPAGVTCAELPQWFFVPLSRDLVPGRLMEVVLVKDDNTCCRLHGSFAGKDGKMVFPGPGRASWDKIFYGVENDQGFGGSCYDETMSVRGGSMTFSSASGGPPVSGDPLRQPQLFVRLLSTRLSDAEGSHLTKLLSRRLSPKRLVLPDTASESLCVADLPGYAKGDLWLVRVSGLVMVSGGCATPGMQLLFHSVDQAGNKHSYDSPWAPRAVRNASAWTRFDLAFPFAPATFPGKLTDVEARFCLQSPLLSRMTGPMPLSPQAQFKDVRLEIRRLAGSPLASGYEIY